MPSTIDYTLFNKTQECPPSSAFAVTPSDATDLTLPIRYFMVTVAGTINVIFKDDTTPVTLTVLSGVQYYGLISRVRSTGTTATGIIGMY
jgi:hypothetical protein